MKKINEKLKNNNFTKLTRTGISLIVLVITIIVIIILAAAIIISLNNNNPIMESKKARYESDRANMQAIFTNAVSKVMAKNLGTVSVTAGQINTVTNGVKEALGKVSYTVTDAANGANSSGIIIFDKGENTDTTFYTGKKLPIYAAGETKWHVDTEGVISLEVAGSKFGEGIIIDIASVKLVSGTEFKDTIPDTATSVIFTDKVAPDTATLTDVSANGEGGVVAWLEDTTYYVSTQTSGIKALANEDCADMFYDKSSLISIDLNYLDTSKVSDFSYMFYNCSGLTSLDVSKFNTSNANNLSHMFFGCKGITSLDVSKFDTSNVTGTDRGGAAISGGLSGMFWGCSGLKQLDVSKWDTSNVITMGGLFYGCSGLTTIDVSNFNTSNVLDMNCMFSHCTNLTYLDITNFNTSKVREWTAMFGYVKSLSTVDLSNFDLSSAEDMSWMFEFSSFTSLDLSKWDTSNVESMNRMFVGCAASTIDVSSFVGDNLTDTTRMFDACYNLTEIDLRNLDTSKITESEYMFNGCGKVTEAYARSQADADMLNGTYNKPTKWAFNSVAPIVEITINNQCLDLVNVSEIPEVIEGGITKLTLTSIDNNKLITSFKINGVEIEGDTFTVPVIGGEVIISDVQLVDYVVIESEHNPYPTGLVDKVYGEAHFEGAKSLTIILETEILAMPGYDFFYDWIYLYNDPNSTTPYENKKYGNVERVPEAITIPGDYVKITFTTYEEDIGMNGYGFKAIVYPNY